MNDADHWVWECVFHADPLDSFPKIVRSEVRTLMDEITVLANMRIDPNALGTAHGNCRRHGLPCGGWIDVLTLPNHRPRLLAVVSIVPPVELL